MRRGLDIATRILALFVIHIVPWPVIAQTTPPSLAEQLQAQYNFVKTGNDANGLTIIEPGTVLVIQKAGILGVQPTSLAMCPAKYQDGNLKAPNGFCLAMVKSVSRYFTVGEKVYPSKLEVNVPKEKISIQLLDCDSCNGVNPPTFYKSEITFQFDKGYLEKASVPQVQDVMAQVLTIDESAAGPEQGQQQIQDAPAEVAPPPADAAPAEPPTIEIGQTIDQVVNALGKPDKIVNLGAKKIYIYKDVKITFVNGKVTEAN
ncbi:MAG TPA: hypothetical protein VMT28_06750 [Terriglobales bacterium]|jgi:hypothetical protein|nr:hypothetical protein [Terriglobales bacterium]